MRIICLVSLGVLMSGCADHKSGATVLWNQSQYPLLVRFADGSDHALRIKSIAPGSRAVLTPNNSFSKLEELSFTWKNRDVQVPGWKQYHKGLGCAGGCRIRFTADGRVGFSIDPNDKSALAANT